MQPVRKRVESGLNDTATDAADIVMVSETAEPALANTPGPRLWEKAREWSGSGRAAIAIRGSAWSIGGYAATQLLRTLATLVLARRFLGPEPFGVVGLVGVLSPAWQCSPNSASWPMSFNTHVVTNPILKHCLLDPSIRGLTIWIVATIAAYPLA